MVEFKISFLENELLQVDNQFPLYSLNILDSDIVCITSPTHPVYQTPSFFNKKKVEANNKKLKEEYEESCRLYSARLLEEKEREIER